jgi:DNA-binding LytR/AlgR family response regulator
LHESRKLEGRCFLVVEDEYLIAADLAASLELLGAEVVGPAGSVAEALTLVENEGGRLDGAVLDINLRNERVYPVADVLAARGVPFVFTTGYDAAAVPSPYSDAPRCEKPVDKARLIRCLSR